MDRRCQLLAIADALGPVYGTEDFCLFLYSLVRMYAPQTVVELGTGLGVSALAMALAVKLNGRGHVWSIDDLGGFASDANLLSKITKIIQETWQVQFHAPDSQQYFDEIARCLGVQDVVTFLYDKIKLDERGYFDRYPFADVKIDLLFADFRHSPKDILAILGHFIPRMAPASSIFIDSASTFWPSYLLLEHLVMQLNRGTVPMALQDSCCDDLQRILQNRRITLVHLTEAKNRGQNSTAWLKLEPVDLQPNPRTQMRGF